MILRDPKDKIIVKKKEEAYKLALVFIRQGLHTLRGDIVDVSLFIGGSGHGIFTPPLLVFFLTQPDRNVASAEILPPPHCSHLSRNSSSLLPDANVSAGPTDPPTTCSTCFCLGGLLANMAS